MTVVLNKRLDARKPFGEECCEAEVQIFRESYEHYFFQHIPFIKDAVKRETYLIAGRRGAGKTSLTKYFEFQDEIENCSVINVDESKVYDDILQKISTKIADNDDASIKHLEKLWELAIWGLIFNHFKQRDPVISNASLKQEGKKSVYLKEIFKSILEKYLSKDFDDLIDVLDNMLSSDLFNKAKEKSLQILADEPLLISIDSRERYDTSDLTLMRATAALIQIASNFNIEYSYEGIHLKIVVSGEVMPHLQESVVLNPLKSIRDPLILNWRPKTLLRLVAWRFYQYLIERDEYKAHISENGIDWDKYNDVHARLWTPFFGGDVVNFNGFTESSFAFVLRHTQLRPRQLVLLCNKIAAAAMEDGTFPIVAEQTLKDITYKQEMFLAEEIINSYQGVYSNVHKILDALQGMPMRFSGSYLDKIAKKTAGQWTNHVYSTANFRQLLTELGIVGRIRNESEIIIEADFEYCIDGRLVINEDTECVLHPMFGRKFNVDINCKQVVYPFPDHYTLPVIDE